MRLEARRRLFHALVLTAFLVGVSLRFMATGWLRGNLYDVVVVLVLASVTFSVRSGRLLESSTPTAKTAELRLRQSVLNGSSVVAWAAIAGGAELLQGVLTQATGKDVLGRFDTVDLACYLAGASISYAVNGLLYLDRMD